MLTPHTALTYVITTKLYKLVVTGDYLHTHINYGIGLYDLRRRITKGNYCALAFVYSHTKTLA